MKSFIVSARATLVASIWLLSAISAAGAALPVVHGGGDSSVAAPIPIADSAAAAPSIPSPGFVERVGDDLLVQAGAAFRMDEADALWIGGAVLVTGSLILVDEPIDATIRDLKDRHRLLRQSSAIVTELGGTYGVVGSLLFTGYSFILGSAADRETSMMLGEALATSTVWVRIGKFLTGRERPEASYVNDYPRGGRWSGPLEQINGRRGRGVACFDAFPSGHTTTAFAIATVFAERYSENLWIPVTCYGLATIVGLSRMIEHTHWASDIVVGACLGYLCGRQVCFAHQEQPSAPGGSDRSGLPRPARSETRLYIDLIDGVPALGCAYRF